MANTLLSQKIEKIMLLALTPILGSAIYIGGGLGLVVLIVVLVLIFR